MGNELMAYLDRLELMAFFSGYPLLYAFVQVFAGAKNTKPSPFFGRLVKLLPLAYALTGTLYLGLLFRNLYPDYSIRNLTDQFQFPYLRAWGLFSLLFWIPFFNRRPLFSLLHSLVFFFFLIKDLIVHLSSRANPDMVRNDMKIYTDSLLLNTGTLLIILLLHTLITYIRNKQNAPEKKRPY